MDLHGKRRLDQREDVAALNSGPGPQQVNLAQNRPVVIIYATLVVLPDGNG
jgi:hypothetical protein